jgi:hypothetical protein
MLNEILQITRRISAFGSLATVVMAYDMPHLVWRAAG